MNEVKKREYNYDAWLHWNVTSRCNLHCEYCFSFLDKQKNIEKAKIPPFTLKRTFGIFTLGGKISKALRMSIPTLIRTLNFKINEKKGKVPKIDIPALMKTLDRAKKVFKISFTGGEPFLVPNINDALAEIAKKHYVHIVTNLVAGDIKEFAEKINPKRVLSIHASLHIKELERLNLLDRFINNFLLCRRKGFNINAFEIAYPPLLSEVEKYKRYFGEKGIEIHFSPFLGTYNGKLYPNSYTKKELEIFGLDESSLKPHYQKGKICNAGYNVGVVSPTGVITPCSQIQKEIGNIYEKVEFNNQLTICPFDYCVCPLNTYDRYLFEKALQSEKSNSFRKT